MYLAVLQFRELGSHCSSSYKMTPFPSVEDPYTTIQIFWLFFFYFLNLSSHETQNWLKNFGLISSPSTWKPLSPALFKGMKE